MSLHSKGALFRQAVANEKPLQIVGAINAYAAKMAARSGYQALYLSGGGVANASYGMPDLGMTGLSDVLVDVRRITAATDLPLLVDIDTGFGSALNIERTIREMITAGAAAVHMEDQVAAKRCGHRPNKEIVSSDEMVDRIVAANSGRIDPDFVLMARSDAIANEGLSKAIDRMQAYIEAGADMIFPEAVTKLEDYATLAKELSVPILANITEFGKTPLFTTQELGDAGVAMALYPLSAFRAMNAAALNVYQTLRKEGTQQNVVDTMQTRMDLYDYLDYQDYEDRLDNLFAKEKANGGS